MTEKDALFARNNRFVKLFPKHGNITYEKKIQSKLITLMRTPDITCYGFFIIHTLTRALDITCYGFIIITDRYEQ